MKNFLLALVLTLVGAARLWADCKPRDFYTRSAKIYISPSQGKQNLKKAEELMTEALKCYPQDGEVQYTAAWLFSQKKEFQKMMDALNAAIQFSPEWKPKAETLRAGIFLETFNQAYGFLEKGIRAATGKDSVKNLRRAIDLYRGCMLIDSTGTGPYKNLSVAYAALNIPDSSALYNGRAYQIRPDSVRWGFAYAADLINLQNRQSVPRYGEAITVLEKVVQKDTLYWEAWGLLGQLYGVEGRLPEMAATYRRLSRQFPDSADFLKQLANYELQSGSNSKEAAEARRHYLGADTLFAQYLSKNAADSSAWHRRGLAVLSLKEFARAAGILEETVKQFPSFPDAWEALAGAYAQMGNRAKEAREAFERARKLRGEKEE